MLRSSCIPTLLTAPPPRLASSAPQLAERGSLGTRDLVKALGTNWCPTPGAALGRYPDSASAPRHSPEVEPCTSYSDPRSQAERRTLKFKQTPC